MQWTFENLQVQPETFQNPTNRVQGWIRMLNMLNIGTRQAFTKGTFTFCPTVRLMSLYIATLLI